MHKNLYSILDLDPNKNHSKDEIKKAYKKQILKYHPDKNKEDTTEKFKEIQTAYEILSDDTKKKEYDNLPASEKVKYYETFKSLIIKKYPYVNDYFNSMIKNFYDGNEENFQNDIESFNFNSIYKNFIDKIPDFFDKVEYKKPDQIKPLKKYVIDVNINGKLTGNLCDRYQNKYQKLLIERETKEEISIFVPFIEDIYILEDEGEIGINNINGNIIIEVDVPNIYNNFTKLGDDLYVEIEISLYEYLYGGIIKFNNLDNNEIILEHDSLLENNIIKLEGKGFIKNSNEERGDMIIIIKIKDLGNLKEKIKNI